VSGIRSTYGTPTYGPFRDGTVQTYFRWSPPHIGRSGLREIDVQLIKPAIGRDICLGHKIGSVKLGS